MQNKNWLSFQTSSTEVHQDLFFSFNQQISLEENKKFLKMQIFWCLHKTNRSYLCVCENKHGRNFKKGNYLKEENARSDTTYIFTAEIRICSLWIPLLALFFSVSQYTGFKTKQHRVFTKSMHKPQTIDTCILIPLLLFSIKLNLWKP